jgi:hypothetical protein
MKPRARMRMRVRRILKVTGEVGVVLQFSES